jgi:hypothetical protein
VGIPTEDRGDEIELISCQRQQPFSTDTKGLLQFGESQRGVEPLLDRQGQKRQVPPLRRHEMRQDDANATFGGRGLFYDPIREMGHARGRAHACAFQFDGLDPQALEQAHALTEKNRDEINMDFIQKAQF